MTSLESVSRVTGMSTSQKVGFEDRDVVYAPLVAERMALPMPEHIAARYAKATPKQRAKMDEVRANGFRMLIHDEHVRAGFWK